MTQKENTRERGNRAMRRWGLGGVSDGEKKGWVVGGSVKKSHAFVIFVSIFSFVLFYLEETS